MNATLRIAVLLAAALALPACADARSGDGGPKAATVRFRVAEASRAGAAAGVLRARLEALGVKPGAAAVEGATVTFGVSRELSAEEQAALSRRGRLEFRPVLAQATPAGTPEGAPARAPDGDCSDAAYRERLAEHFAAPERAAARVVACDVEGSAKYVLGPAEATGRDVRSARAEDTPNGVSTGWVVSMEMADAPAWAALTERHVGKQLAIVLDGIVQTAPTVNEPIPDGGVQLSGSFTETTAKALAAVLRSGTLETNVSPG